MITRTPFHRKDRSQILHKRQHLLLKLSTLFLVSTPLWLIKWIFRKPPVMLLHLLKMIHTIWKKLVPDSSKSARRNYIISNDPVIPNSNVRLPTLKPSSEPNLYKDDSLTSQFPTEKFHFKTPLTSLCIFSTQQKFQKNPNQNNDQ